VSARQAQLKAIDVVLRETWREGTTREGKRVENAVHVQKQERLLEGLLTASHLFVHHARVIQSYSRTRGGDSRSNMWTVSTNRTCLLW
jgi:hypothetical protein